MNKFLLSLLPSAPQLALFASAVFVLNATPGVDFLLTVSRTLQSGWRAGLAAALGISAGCVLHTVAAALGLAALLTAVPAAFAALKWAGAAYLVWLGMGLLRQARVGPALHVQAQAAPADSTTALGLSSHLKAGLATNILNPKVALFFLAFLPQFVPATSPAPTASFLLLGAMAIAQGTLFLVAVVAMAQGLKRVGSSPTAQRVLQTAGGLLFMGLALRLIREEPGVSR